MRDEAFNKLSGILLDLRRHASGSSQAIRVTAACWPGELEKRVMTCCPSDALVVEVWIDAQGPMPDGKVIDTSHFEMTQEEIEGDDVAKIAEERWCEAMGVLWDRVSSKETAAV